MIVVAVLVLPVVVIVFSASEPPWFKLVAGVDWLIWLVPPVDLTVRLAFVDDRKAYLMSAWLDVFIVVSSFPALAVLGSSRVLRLWRIGSALRLLKMFRPAAILIGGGRAVERLSHCGGLGRVVAGTAIFALPCGARFGHRTGHRDAMDGAWWAFVAATMVRYDDTSPQSVLGRILAEVPMLFGIGLLGVFTGFVAAHVVEEEEAATHAEIARLHDRLDGIEDALAASRCADRPQRSFLVQISRRGSRFRAGHLDRRRSG